MTTDASGNVLGQQGHYPYGESWYAASSTTKWQFTTYERDSESGNDYAGARYGVNRLGRFSSPDPIGGSPADPQSLNRYPYVRNDPTDVIDPLGLGPIFIVFWECDYLRTFTVRPWVGNEPGYPETFYDVYQCGPFSFPVGRVDEGARPPARKPPAPRPQTPAQAATQSCQQHGQLSFNIPFTHIPVTISLSGTLFGSWSTTNDISLTFPASAGASVDVTIGAPKGPSIPVAVGSGKNLSVGTFLTPSGAKGFSASFGPSVGSPVTVSPTVANACGLRAGGG